MEYFISSYCTHLLNKLWLRAILGEVDERRQQRVSENMREELDELIGYELTDPRVGTVNVIEVHVSPDLRHAHVQLLLGGTAEEQAATLDAVEHAKQFLRHQLSDRLELYRTPELHFQANLPTGLAAKAPQILKRIKRGRPKPEKNAIS